MSGRAEAAGDMVIIRGKVRVLVDFLQYRPLTDRFRFVYIIIGRPIHVLLIHVH